MTESRENTESNSNNNCNGDSKNDTEDNIGTNAGGNPENRLLTDTQSDRRGYFRLKDRVTLEYETLGPDCTETDPYSNELTINPQLKLLSELHKLENESNHLLHSIIEHNRQVGNYLKVLNKRINCLTQFITSDRINAPLHPSHDVSISEGGVAFEADEHLPLGEFLHIKLVLFPTLTNIAAIGKVTYCELHGSVAGQAVHRIGIQFEHITESDRQQLAKHIIQEQSRIRRKQHIRSPK